MNSSEKYGKVRRHAGGQQLEPLFLTAQQQRIKQGYNPPMLACHCLHAKSPV